MKKYFSSILILTCFALSGYSQTVQFTVKAVGTNTIQVYFKPNANIGPVVSNISNITFIFQIPQTYSNPQGTWGIAPNSALIGAMSTNTAASTATGNKWNTLFTSTSNTGISGFTFTSGTEYLMATITTPVGVALADITVMDWGNNRLNNAVSGPAIWSTSLAVDGNDKTNNAAVFYQNSTSTPPVNSGVITAASTVGLIGTPLGIKVLDFTGKLNNGISNLQWNVENETAVNKYDVLYSVDGANWLNAGSVVATNKGGNHAYTFAHDSKLANGSVYYRLRIMSSDGGAEYSNVIRLGANSNPTDNGYKVYPTYLTAGADVTIVAPSVTEKQIQIKDQQGKLVKQLASSSNSIQVATAGFAPGIYYIQVIEKNNVQLTAKFVVN